MFRNISIIGDGGMGTVLGILLCEKNIPVRIWGYDRRQLARIEKERENCKFLPGYKLPADLIFEPDDSRIMSGADLIISAVPCQFVRAIWTRLKEHVTPRFHGDKLAPAKAGVAVAKSERRTKTNTPEGRQRYG
jgi:glycerol-3-phosphate dehydrogenase